MKRCSDRHHHVLAFWPICLGAARARCRECRADVAIGLSNDRIPRREMKLAAAIADLMVLWEPGRERTRLLDGLVAAL